MTFDRSDSNARPHPGGAGGDVPSAPSGGDRGDGPSSAADNRRRTAALLLSLLVFPLMTGLVVPASPPFLPGAAGQHTAWWILILWLIAWEWALLAYLKVALAREKRDLTDVGVPDMGRREWAAAAAAVAVAAGFLLLLPPGGGAREGSLWYLPATPLQRMAWLGAAVTAGACEETLFRGFALTELRRRWGRGAAGTAAAVVVSTAAFVAIHGTGQPAGDAARRAAIGLLFAGLFLWRGHLRGPIYIHFLVDVAALYVL